MKLIPTFVAAALAATAGAQSQDGGGGRYPQTGTFYSYIQSSGAQYVNARYCPLAADKVDCWIDLAKAQTVFSRDSNSYPTIFGAALNNSANRYILQAMTPAAAGGGSCFRRNGNKNYFNKNIPSDRIVHIVCEGMSAKWFDPDGTLGGSAATSGATDGNSRIPLLIFQCNYADTDGGVKIADNWWCDMKLYGFTITSGGKVVRDFKPYRSADGQIGLWDVAENDDPDYERFYPNAGSSVAPFVYGGVSYLPLSDGETVQLLAGSLDIVTPRGYTTVEKAGVGTVAAGAVTAYANLTLSQGTLSFADGIAQSVTAGKLTLKGGASLEVDLSSTICDSFTATTVDLSEASAANPVLVKVRAESAVSGEFTLIAGGLSSGDEEKFASGSSGASLAFAVVEGALKVSFSAAATIAAKATWTNAAGNGELDDPDNWDCYDAQDNRLEGVLPTGATAVRLTGSCAFSCPAGTLFECDSFELDNVTLAADGDWRGVTVPYTGILDVQGHVVKTSKLGNGNVWLSFSDSAGGGELHVEVPFGEQMDMTHVRLGGKIKLVKEGLGTLLANEVNQTYSGGTEVVAGMLLVGAKGNEHSYGAAESTVTVRSGATFDLCGYSNHYDYEFVLDGGTLASTVERGYANHAWLKHIVLTADSVISTVADMGLVGLNPTGDGAAEAVTLELGSHTLTVQSQSAGANFYMCNATVAGSGTLRVKGGGCLHLGNQYNPKGAGGKGYGKMYVRGAEATLDVRDASIDCREGDDVLFANYLSAYTGVADTGDAPIKVTGRFKPGTAYHATQLLDGATVDLSDYGGTLDGTKLSYVNGARINVDFGSRVPRVNTKVVGWTVETKPVGKVKFKSGSCGLNVRDDGLYVASGLALILY